MHVEPISFKSEIPEMTLNIIAFYLFTSTFRPYFITLYGLEGARSLAKQHNDAALAALADLGPEADFLREMAVELLTRSK